MHTVEHLPNVKVSDTIVDIILNMCRIINPPKLLWQFFFETRATQENSRPTIAEKKPLPPPPPPPPPPPAPLTLTSCLFSPFSSAGTLGTRWWRRVAFLRESPVSASSSSFSSSSSSTTCGIRCRSIQREGGKEVGR